ncbi:hypothetical protein [Coleofasciculus chthonoplastes]|uniref:hypothetical protein n=1 Tax=Coleofasciculus chthonoplastes TaxID=64178 RepID=UPI0005C6C70D|nr:hypothetical protein [Coleofasciculus chthonoplastes]
MADLTLGSLTALILKELSSTFEQTTKRADDFKRYASHADFNLPPGLLSWHISELEINLPVHLQLQPVRPLLATTKQLRVTFPSPLSPPPIGRLGGIRMTIQPEPLSPSQE